ncbi:MAG: hypothetical protein ABIN58_00300 [candidate division WOR-3 bacterium]
MLAFLFSVLPVLGDTVELPLTGHDVLGQFRMCWSNPAWRKKMGNSDLFPADGDCETHFFWEGGVITGIRPLINKDIGVGPYQGIDDWVNIAYIGGEIPPEAGPYFRLVPAKKGLLVWLRAYGLTTHENRYDTRSRFTFIAYSEDWPDSKSFLAYYIEDHRSGGVAHVFRAKDKGIVTADLAGDKLLLKGYMDSYQDIKDIYPDLRVHFEGVVVWERKNFYR